MGLTVNVLHYAMDALDQSEQVIAGNVANDQTPGYTERTYDFESSLQAALASGGAVRVTPATGYSTAPAGTNGNNVDLTGQLVQLSGDQLQSQAVADALTAQFRILRGSMGGGFA